MKQMQAECLHGHPMVGRNVMTIRDKSRATPRRVCRECGRISSAKQYAAQRVRRASARFERIEAWKRDVPAADLAWAAGHFEGEGTISIGAMRRKGYARPVASLVSTDKEIIDLFSAWWPTSIAGKKPRFPTQNSRAVYRWEINSAVKVRAFIDQIGPFLRTERCRAKFALVGEFVDKILEPHTGKTKQRFPEYVERIRRLNHRGAAPFLGQIMLPSGETVLERVVASEMLALPAPQS